MTKRLEMNSSSKMSQLKISSQRLVSIRFYHLVPLQSLKLLLSHHQTTLLKLTQICLSLKMLSHQNNQLQVQLQKYQFLKLQLRKQKQRKLSHHRQLQLKLNLQLTITRLLLREMRKSFLPLPPRLLLHTEGIKPEKRLPLRRLLKRRQK